MIAETRELLVPWMKHSSRFINPIVANEMYTQRCIQLLDIQKVSTESLLSTYILPLPDVSIKDDLSSYRQLIAALDSLGSLYTVKTVLVQNKIAIDGYRSRLQTAELFDHEDEIFKSAFRGQENSKFLHNEVRDFRRLWLQVGLRHRENTVLKPSDYLPCLQSLSQRQSSSGSPSDATLASDSEVVLLPLTTPNSSIRGFSSYWSRISREQVFVSRSDFSSQPEHRRITMSDLATKRPILALSEVISYKHVAICWSQTPFSVHAPAAEVFERIRGGNPLVEMVWKHLEHLAALPEHLRQEDLASFLSDLHQTYMYLQDHTDECQETFTSRRSKELWLNIASLEGQQAFLMDVKSSWNEIEDLVLSSSRDKGRVKALRPSLERYEKLLRALGCKSISYPAVTRSVIHQNRSVSSSLRRLRTEKKLLDITFCTEGKEIQAHRVVLAATSEKFATQWSGSFPIEAWIEFDYKADPDCFISYHALSTMINYAYEDQVNWSEMQASTDDDEATRDEKLHMLLDLHKGADFWQIPELMSQVEEKILDADKLFINIENVVAIRDQAEYVGAKNVEKMCAKFIEENRAVVNRANSRTTE